MASPAKTIKKNLRNDPVSSLPMRTACTIGASDSIAKVLQVMAQNGVGCAMIMDASTSRLAGIFTESDFLYRVVLPKLDVNQPIQGVMTSTPKVVQSSASVFQAIQIMEKGRIRHLPVLADDGSLTGVISLKEIIHYLVEYFPATVYNLPPTPVLAQPAREGA